MVHDEVQADVDAAIMAGSSQCCKIIHGSKFFLNLPEISNCITAVTASPRGVKEWHQMQIIDIAFLYIIQFGFQIRKEYRTKALTYIIIPVRSLRLYHVGFFFAIQIRFFQGIISHIIEFLQDFEKIIEMHCDIWVILIQFTVKPFQLVKMTGKTLTVNAIIITLVFKSDRFGFCSLDFDSLSLLSFYLNRFNLFCLDFYSLSLLGFNFNRFGLFRFDL